MNFSPSDQMKGRKYQEAAAARKVGVKQESNVHAGAEGRSNLSSGFYLRLVIDERASTVCADVMLLQPHMDVSSS